LSPLGIECGSRHLDPERLLFALAPIRPVTSSINRMAHLHRSQLS
jgi:hypothetical protein